MAKFVAVEFDLWDESLPGIRTLRIAAGNGGVYSLDGNRNRVIYEDRLILPIQIGIKISGEQYGQSIRGTANSGVIEFAIGDEGIWPWLGYHWVGREFRIFQRDDDLDLEDDLEGFDPIYIGKILDLTHNTIKASVKITDSSLTFDKPLISNLYEEGDPNLSETTAKTLVGLPKPKIWGQVKNIAPILENESLQTWRLSSSSLSSVDELRVGGVPWDKVIGVPGAGEWSVNLVTGVVTLGSVTLGGEVRCDVKAIGWESLTSGGFINEIVSGEGMEVDSLALSNFNTLTPGLIGFYSSNSPINIQDVFDMIMLGAGGWWGTKMNGKVVIGGLEAPNVIGSKTLNEVNISSLQLFGLILPAWRIRVEYERNWEPVSTFFSGVTDAEQKQQAAGGIIAPKFENNGIKTLEPKALDAPLIRSLFVDEVEANRVRDRLSLAWGVTRKLYDLVVYEDGLELYDTIEVDYLMVGGKFRIHGLLLNIDVGNNFYNLQVWG